MKNRETTTLISMFIVLLAIILSNTFCSTKEKKVAESSETKSSTEKKTTYNDTVKVKHPDTDWLKEAKFGVMFHYLPGWGNDKPEDMMSLEDWNKRVNNFDVDGLVAQLEEVGAGYLLFTLGQNTGHWCSPNETYRKIVGKENDKCSDRDLILELGEALHAKGMRLIVYNSSGAPTGDKTVCEKFEWQWGFEEPWGTRARTRRKNHRLENFQNKWNSVLTEWSLRWGDKVDGWWIDGVYFFDEMYNHPSEPNIASFSAALKAGNNDRIVCFCPGPKRPFNSVTKFDDYLPGESDILYQMGTVTDSLTVYMPQQYINGIQLHILSFLGYDWGNGDKPYLPSDLICSYTKFINTYGGAITWDVPHTVEGLIKPEFVKQLKAINEYVNKK